MSAFAGTAHVKIEPDLSGFKEELKAKLGPATQGAKVPINLNLDRASAARVDAEVKAQTRPITRKVKLEHDHSSFQATEKAFGGVEKRVGGLGGALKGLYGEAAKITAVGLGSQAVSALGAAAVTTTAALAPLAGVLAAYPAVASAGAQAVGTWKLAFNGVSAAVGGINQQLDKNSKAFRELTPEGKKFAEQLERMKGPMRELSQTSQRGLLPGLESGMQSAMKNFPILNKHVGATARVMGGLADEAGRLVGSKGFGRDLDTQMGRNEVTIKRLGDAGLYLGDGMRHIVIAAGPLVDWLTKTALAGAKNVDEWAAAGRKSGEFAKFFGETKHVMTDVGHIAGDLGTGLFNIFKLAYPEGKNFLDVQVKLADKFKDWTESAGGKNRIKQFFHDARPAMDEAEKLIGALVGEFGHLGEGHQVAPLLHTLRVDLLPAFSQLVTSTTAAFGPDFLNFVKQGALLLAEFSGTSGPLVSSVKLFTEMAEGVRWLLHNVPGLKPIIYTIAIAGGINKALGISSAISGLVQVRTQMKLIAALGAAEAGEGLLPGALGISGGGAGKVTGKITSVVGRGIRGAAVGGGIALLGTTVSQVLGAAVPGGVGDGIAKIGTDASIGAGVGSFFGPGGTVAGALTGGLVGAVSTWITHDAKQEGDKWADEFVKDIPGKVNAAVAAGARRAAEHPPPTPPRYTPPPGMPVMPQTRPPVAPTPGHPNPAYTAQLQAFDRERAEYTKRWNAWWRGMYKDAFNKGYTAGNEVVSGMKSQSHHNIFFMTTEAYRKLMTPPANLSAEGKRIWRNTGAQQIIEYTAGLERNHKLPAGATDRMIKTLEARFPGLRTFLRKQGEDTGKNLAATMNFNAARRKLTDFVSKFRDNYGDINIATKLTDRNIVANANTMWRDLTYARNHSHGKERQDYQNQLDALSNYLKDYYKRQNATTGAGFDQIGDTTTKKGRHIRDLWNNALVDMQTASALHTDATKKDFLTTFEDLRKKGGAKFSGIKDDAILAFSALQGGVGPIGDQTAQAMYAAFKAMGLNAKELASALGIKVPDLSLSYPKSALQKYGAAKTKQLIMRGAATGALVQIGQPGAQGHDSIPLSVGGTDIVVGEGEQVAVLTRHQQADFNRMLARQGGLSGYFNRNKRPHYMATGGLATATYFGGPGDPATGHIGYRGDDLNIHPDSYAELGMGTRLGGLPYMTPLNLTYHGKTARAFKRDIGAGAPGAAIDLWYMLANALGFTGKDTVQINGPAGVNIQITGGGGGGPAPQLGNYTFNAPPGIMKSLGQGAISKGRDQWNQWLQAHAPVATTGAGVSTAGITGPAGLGTFDGLQVANWIIPVLNWARGHGWGGRITSGFRPGSITNSGNVSNHASASYPGGAVDVGDETAVAQGEALWNVVKDYPGSPKLYSAAWGPGAWGPYKGSAHDYGHFSATGRALGGLIKAATGHLSTGGAGLAPRGALTGAGAALTGAGATTLKHAKWWRNLAPILREIKSKSKHGKPDLTRFLDRIKGLGLGGLQDTITQNVNTVTKDAAYAETAAGLIDTDALGRALANDLSWQKPELYPAGWDPAKDALPPNVENIQKGVIDNFLQQYKVLGKTQLGWLTHELADQATLRGNLVTLAKKIREDWLQRTRVLDAARKKARGLRDHITALTKQINGKLKQLHPPKGHKPPSKAQANQLNKDIKRLRGDLAGDQRELDALVHPDTGVIPVTEAQLQTLTDALGTGMHGGQDLPKLYQNYGPSADGVLGQLYALEGPVTSPFRRLGANGARTLTAEGPTVWFGDIGNVLTQIAGYDKQWFQQPSLPSTSEAAAIPEDLFAKQLQQWAGERSGLGALEGALISRYGGSFDKGGTVPGPVGAPILITAHGGEEVVSLEDRSRGDHTFEIHGDPRTVALLEQMIEKVNVRSNRGQARSADRRMRLPGNQAR